MIFASEIPELAAHPRGFPGVWLKVIFVGFGEAEGHGTKGLIVNYVRSVEAAFAHYRHGRVNALAFIERDDPQSVPIHEAMRASISFEDCISHVHRAIRCMRGLRQKGKMPDAVQSLFHAKPSFMQGSVQERIRNTRNAIHHTYQQVFDGKIPVGSPFALGLEGRETPVPESNQPGQVLKTWDRVRIGPHDIKFAELVSWLEEMGDCVERLI